MPETTPRSETQTVSCAQPGSRLTVCRTTLFPDLINYSIDDSATLASVSHNDLPLHSLTLSEDEVHVWHAALDDRLADRLKLILSEDEISRANRFHFAKDRNHYIVARGLLRRLLAAYLGVSSAELQFLYADKGKPYLKETHRGSINFNLAHSGDMAIYAFSRGRELGVDLELMREDLAGEKIAERFFSRREISSLRSLPVELRKQAFFNCWTRKEAYIKARGEGLSMPLDEFDVSLAPREPAALLKNYKDSGEVSRWTMQSISVAPGYVAALVVEGQDWRLKKFGFEPVTDG
ncbi:MAG: 4'-phosphopantetheinyl transferase superfamily protein [Acidobacteriota bacterium]|nr:4'-phosphopantetheinyl transferase superfamily protein [Acidobacteriota bacterium]